MNMPLMEVTLSPLSTFPGITKDFRVDNVEGMLFYKETIAAQECEVRQRSVK